MSVCVHVYMWVYICVGMCMYGCIYVYASTCVDVYACINIEYMCECVSVCMCNYSVHACMWVCGCGGIHMYKQSIHVWRWICKYSVYLCMWIWSPFKIGSLQVLGFFSLIQTPTCMMCQATTSWQPLGCNSNKPNRGQLSYENPSNTINRESGWAPSWEKCTPPAQFPVSLSGWMAGPKKKQSGIQMQACKLGLPTAVGHRHPGQLWMQPSAKY